MQIMLILYYSNVVSRKISDLIGFVNECCAREIIRFEYIINCVIDLKTFKPCN